MVSSIQINVWNRASLSIHFWSVLYWDRGMDPLWINCSSFPRLHEVPFMCWIVVQHCLWPHNCHSMIWQLFVGHNLPLEMGIQLGELIHLDLDSKIFSSSLLQLFLNCQLFFVCAVKLSSTAIHFLGRIGKESCSKFRTGYQFQFHPCTGICTFEWIKRYELWIHILDKRWYLSW